MKLRANHDYAHSTDAVYALFMDADEVEAKQAALGARKIRIITCDKAESGGTIRFVRELPAEVPGILSRFLQPWNSVEQTEEWRACDGGRFECDLEIDVANVPVTVGGSLRLEPTDKGCVNRVRLLVDCGIPFVGKTLAEFVAADCKRLMRLEYEYLCKRLAAA